MTTFTAGQRLLYTPGDARDGWPVEVTVTRVGRKWIGVSGTGCADTRFDANTLLMDHRGRSSPGRVWLSLEDYNAEVDRFRLHEKLRALANRHGNPYSSQQLMQAIAALSEPDTSVPQRLDRLNWVGLLAAEVFGDMAAAKTWLSTPCVALGGNTPLHLCETDRGAKQVRRVLHAIEWGGAA